MEINKANNYRLNNNTHFLGKEEKPVQEEREQVSSQNDKAANEAITNMGKAIVSPYNRTDKSETDDISTQTKNSEKLSDSEILQEIIDLFEKNGKRISKHSIILEYTDDDEDLPSFFSLYKDSPEFMKKVFSRNIYNGNSIGNIFATPEYMLAYEHKKNPEAVETLFDMKNPEECRKTRGEYRFNHYDICNLADIYLEHKDAVDAIAEFRAEDNMLRGRDILDFYKSYEKNKEAVTDYFKRGKIITPDFFLCSKDHIELAINTYENLPEYFKSLLNTKYKNGQDRFSESEKCNIAIACESHPIEMKSFLERKDDKGDYRYGGEAIASLLTLNLDTVTSLSNIKDKKGNNRFNTGEIVRLAKIYEDHTDSVIKLSNICNKNGLPILSAEDIAKHISDYEKHPKEFLKFAQIFDKNGNPRNCDEISELTELYINYARSWFDINPVKKLSSMTNRKGDFKFSSDNISKLAEPYNKYKDFINQMAVNEDFSGNDITNIAINLSDDNIDRIKNLCKNYKKDEIKPNQIALIAMDKRNELSVKQLKALNKKIGYKNASKLSVGETKLAYKLRNAYGAKDINEISIKDKRELLKGLISCNSDLFDATYTIKKLFPLIPINQEEYCSMLPALVRSIGIETNELSEKKTEEFNKDLNILSSSLKEISDEDFANLEITQEYSKDDFIKDVREKIKDLPQNEKQKVYDYFGFELHHNKNTETGYDIAGYPVNLNNGHKLSKIENPQTKSVIEDLRENVVRFSENNRIKCDTPEIEETLNNIVEVLPELRPQIGKVQHGSHDYDVFKHSLKVMQKISQDPNFKSLNDSDKKIMLLASLLHDITKKEGFSDPTHAAQSSFDAVFIAKKFNLSKKEELKLYTLIRHHEWLEGVNTAKTEQQLTKRLQSVAYDLQHDNVFDMELMFTHADLRAVKKDNSFHDKTEGKSRIDFNWNIRSFGESADLYAIRIKDYIKELKKSQPILPTTKLPNASKIDEKITTVNPDGSTNIKGVYKNNEGLVIIKYNEVEDWEAIGLPKGTVSHGIHVSKGTKGDAELNEDVDTGNIKFIVHGLDYENQLAKFDAFSLLDSDALLSVSYAERPESKYRFFRAQGVILDVDTEYIHGGGNTDAGSGCGKDINEFKKNYIFGGNRESDRLYISDLIKKTTGMTDEEYVDFVEKNKNKSMNEIEPPEIRDTMIKTFATINSNTRKGKREYNEMYVSNPNSVNAVFAYNIDYNENIGNPVDFLKRTNLGKHEKGYNGADSKSAYERTKFLQEYAIKHDLPFVVFGD